MSKISYPPAQPFPVTTNATTAGPGAVAAITLSPAYRDKTTAVVLTRESGVLTVRVFRVSTSPGGLGGYSGDDYARGKSGRLEKVGKAPQKFERPAIPQGARLLELNGIPLWTMHAMSSEEIDRLRADLPEILSSPPGE